MTNKTSEKNKYGPPLHVKYPKSKIITLMMWSNFTFLTIEGDYNIIINDFKVFSNKRNEYVT